MSVFNEHGEDITVEFMARLRGTPEEQKQRRDADRALARKVSNTLFGPNSSYARSQRDAVI